MRELSLGQIVERIGLILCGGLRETERIAPVLEAKNLRIVAGRDIIRAEQETPLQQRLPLHKAVAGDTGIRGAPQAVLPHKVINDIALEFRAKVHHIVGNVQHLGDAARVLHGGNAATAALLLDLALCLALPDLHGHADHLIALLLQEIGRDRAVHAAGHPDDHLLSHPVLPLCLRNSSRRSA